EKKQPPTLPIMFDPEPRVLAGVSTSPDATPRPPMDSRSSFPSLKSDPSLSPASMEQILEHAFGANPNPDALNERLETSLDALREFEPTDAQAGRRPRPLLKPRNDAPSNPRFLLNLEKALERELTWKEPDSAPGQDAASAAPQPPTPFPPSRN